MRQLIIAGASALLAWAAYNIYSTFPSTFGAHSVQAQVIDDSFKASAAKYSADGRKNISVVQDTHRAERAATNNLFWTSWALFLVSATVVACAVRKYATKPL